MTLTKLSKNLDDVWSMIIHKRANERCEVTHPHKCKGFLVAHHVYWKKRHSGTRWCIQNGILICQNLHYLVHNNRIVFWTTVFQVLLYEKYGFDLRSQEYICKSETPFLKRKFLLEETYENLKEELKNV